MAEFTAALIARDMPAALALLAEDVVFLLSNGTTIRGKDAFSAAMTANWARVEDYRYQTLEPTWIAQSDGAAAVIYGFAWSGVARGENVGGAGRATRVFRNGPDGWLLAHEHVSAGQWQP